MIEYIGKGKAKLTVSIGSGEHRRRKSKTVSYTNKKELERLHQKFEDEVRHNPYIDTTVEELIDHYIENKKMCGLKATTERGYNHAKERIISFMGDFIAREVTPYQVECFVADLAKQYAPKTVHNTIGLLNSAYMRAVRTGQLMTNPCQYVALPKKQKPDIKVFSEHEMLEFCKALKDERIDYKVAYELCLLCGMRRSEVLGLKEGDINIPLKCVTISHTRHRVNGEDIEQDTKTEQSHRTLALPDVVVEDIKTLLKEHDRPYKYTDYLIQDGFGHPLNPSVLTNHISEIEDKAGLPRINVHGLRHTFASMLNREGVDIARISRELGHSNLTTTLNVYTHVFDGATSSSRGIADALNKKVANSVATSLPLTEDDFTAVSIG